MAQPTQTHADIFSEEVGLDENVKAEFPLGCKVVSVNPSGKSLWVRTVRIDIQLSDGSLKAYFKKSASGDIGYSMMRGAFAAETALYNTIPKNVPRPLAWGTYQSQPDSHFYICDFVEMLDEVPSAQPWAATVTSLHMNSMGKSPEAKFGFQVTTYLANVPVNNSWNLSWEIFWAQQMKSLLDQEEALNGPDDEFIKIKYAYFNAVIPRLLRPLETHGRSIKPCLIHSDLWPGNIKPRVDEFEICVFDACAYWGHNEADLGSCRNPEWGFGKTYLEAYWKHIPISEPQEDFDDRNALYELKFHVLLSVMYSKEPRYRRIAIDKMRYLVDKFCNEV
jgi:protein-ribulosamine 3-kinase